MYANLQLLSHIYKLTFEYVGVFLDFNILISYILYVFLLNTVKVSIFYHPLDFLMLKDLNYLNWLLIILIFYL